MVIHILYPYSANRIVSSAKQIVSSRKVGNTMYINYLFLFYHDAILLFIFAFGFLEIIEQILFFTLGSATPHSTLVSCDIQIIRH